MLLSRMIFLKPKMERNIIPPDTKNTCSFGSYCTKVFVTSDDKEFIGYGQKESIIDKTTQVCNRYTKVCSEPEITFIGNVRNCNGHVMIRDGDKITFVP